MLREYDRDTNTIALACSRLRTGKTYEKCLYLVKRKGEKNRFRIPATSPQKSTKEIKFQWYGYCTRFVVYAAKVREKRK